MEWIRRLLGEKSSRDVEAFTIAFPGNPPRRAVRAPNHADPRAVIRALALPRPTPTIFISGGAGAMSAEAVGALRSIIEDGLAPFASERQISLIDGGTSSGTMALIGSARQRRGYDFPLIGVAPERMVIYPGRELSIQGVELDAGHSHFVLTDGDQFGAESELILRLAAALSESGARKRLTMVINGGEVVKREAQRCATRKPRFPLLVLEGSGRFADELAASRKRGSSDPLIRDILDKGIVHFLPVSAGAENLYRWLENFFGY